MQLSTAIVCMVYTGFQCLCEYNSWVKSISKAIKYSKRQVLETAVDQPRPLCGAIVVARSCADLATNFLLYPC